MHVLRVVDAKVVEEEGLVIFYLESREELAPLLESAQTVEASLDVMYGEEDDVPYLILNMNTGEVEIVAELPYGKVWEVLRDGRQIVAVMPIGDDPESWPMVGININDFLRGFVFGAERLWKEISRTYD
ncbi:MAG: hypothetical protein GXO29_03020 [Thermotogae bacterium]|nr:hypothetical protein [Thermotogota bacterium]